MEGDSKLNKIGKIVRKWHRLLTPVFVVVTVVNMFIWPIPAINLLQKVLMLTMAVSGTYLYVQIYYNRNKNKKRKKSME